MNKETITKINTAQYENYFRGNDVPEKLKETAVAIMKRFSINGLCDAMYICNVIAVENKIGDGLGDFRSDVIRYPERAAKSLRYAYGGNITDDDLAELTEIIRSGALDREKAQTGIKAYIERCAKEMETQEDTWRKDFLLSCIGNAKETLNELSFKCDVVLCQKDGYEGLSLPEIQSMYSCLRGEQAFPVEITAKEHVCSALGFITDDAYSKLEYDLLGLSEFIAAILDDNDKETDGGVYLLDDIAILMKYEFGGQE